MESNDSIPPCLVPWNKWDAVRVEPTSGKTENFNGIGVYRANLITRRCSTNNNHSKCRHGPCVLWETQSVHCT